MMTTFLDFNQVKSDSVKSPFSKIIYMTGYAKGNIKNKFCLKYTYLTDSNNLSTQAFFPRRINLAPHWAFNK